MRPILDLAEQHVESSLRVALIEGGVSACRWYDSGWRALPFALVARFRGGIVVCEREGSRSASVPDGSAVVIPTGVRHRFVHPAGPLIESCWAHMRFTISEAIDLLALFDIPAVIGPPAAARIGDLCADLVRPDAVERERRRLPDLVRRKALETRLLEEIVAVSAYRAAAPAMLARIERMVPVLRYIDDHAADPLPRERLASAARVSPGYFDAIFRQAVGLTPQEYIKRLRVRRAQELLIHTALPVKRVASAVGYGDPFHFSRQFRAVCGMSPLAYRRLIAATLFDGPGGS